MEEYLIYSTLVICRSDLLRFYLLGFLSLWSRLFLTSLTADSFSFFFVFLLILFVRLFDILYCSAVLVLLRNLFTYIGEWGVGGGGRGVFRQSATCL